MKRKQNRIELVAIPGRHFVPRLDRQIRRHFFGLAGQPGADTGPLLSQAHHGGPVHQPVPKLVAELFPYGVFGPARLLEEWLGVGCEENDVLHVPPGKVPVGLQGQGRHASGDGSARRMVSCGHQPKFIYGLEIYQALLC